MSLPEPTPYPANYPYPPQPAAKGPGAARWIAPLALVVSLLAAGAAGWALLKPAPEPPSVGNPAVANPKAQACSAFFLVSNGVALQSRIDIGPDPVAQQAVAANARLAMAGGADYIRSKLASNTPADLAEPLTAFADQLQTIAQYYLAGQNNDNPEQTARLAEADKTTKQLVELCK
ncbi:MAG: hypothetical protein ACR2JI_06275 [Mycobacterium sp.]